MTLKNYRVVKTLCMFRLIPVHHGDLGGCDCWTCWLWWSWRRLTGAEKREAS